MRLPTPTPEQTIIARQDRAENSRIAPSGAEDGAARCGKADQPAETHKDRSEQEDVPAREMIERGRRERGGCIACVFGNDQKEGGQSRKTPCRARHRGVEASIDAPRDSTGVVCREGVKRQDMPYN